MVYTQSCYKYHYLVGKPTHPFKTQITLNKLLKTGIVTKTKVQNLLTWDFANTDDVSNAVNDDNIFTHDDISRRKNNETQTNQDLESSNTLQLIMCLNF